MRTSGFLAAVVPVLSILPFALLSLAPWSAPDAVNFALPLVMLAAVFFWSLRQPGSVPLVLVFLVGLLTDLVDDGALGYWALLYLIGTAVAIHVPVTAVLRRDGLLAWAIFAGAVALVVVAGWLVASLYYLAPVPFMPLLLGGALAIVAYGPVTYLLAPIEEQVGIWHAVAKPFKDGI